MNDKLINVLIIFAVIAVLCVVKALEREFPHREAFRSAGSHNRSDQFWRDRVEKGGGRWNKRTRQWETRPLWDRHGRKLSLAGQEMTSDEITAAYEGE